MTVEHTLEGRKEANVADASRIELTNARVPAIPHDTVASENRVLRMLDAPETYVMYDYGGKLSYFVAQLSRAPSEYRAAIAHDAASLLGGAAPGRVGDLLEILEEVAIESPSAREAVEPVVAKLLVDPSDSTDLETRRAALAMLCRCEFPGRDWAPLITPYLENIDVAFVALRALDRQHPGIALGHQQAVLDLAERHGVPTDLFCFVMAEQRKKRAGA